MRPILLCGEQRTRRRTACNAFAILAAGLISAAARVSADAEPAIVAGQVFRDCPKCPEMVPVAAGRFLIGSPESEPDREGWDKGSESPRREVSIARPFAIGQLAVTRAQYAAFIAATGHDTSGGCHTFDGTDWTLDPGVKWRATDIAQDDDHPVVCVSHADAVAYIGWLNASVPSGLYRLPSEAEREYAARAGTTTAYWWGGSITRDQANYAGSRTAPGTAPALSYAPNPWGMYQVHGNVWEWTADCYLPSYGDLPDATRETGAARTDRGCDRRSLRGGAWNRQPATLRAAYRTGLDPAFRGHSIGFRVVRSASP